MPFQVILILKVYEYAMHSGDLEIRPPIGLTESGPNFELVCFVNPAYLERRETMLSVCL